MEEELIIKYALSNGNTRKVRDDIRKNYWQQLIPQLKNTQLFKNDEPTNGHWFNTASIVNGIVYIIIGTRSYAVIRLSFQHSKKEINTQNFNQIFKYKAQIEEAFGSKLNWDVLPDNKISKVTITLDNVSLINENDWDKINHFVIENLPKFEAAFNPYLQKIKT